MESLPAVDTAPNLATQVAEFFDHADLADRISDIKETTVESADDYVVFSTQLRIGEARFQCEITAHIDLREHYNEQIQELGFGVVSVVDPSEESSTQELPYAHLDFEIGRESAFIELAHREVYTQSLGLGGSTFLYLVEQQLKNLIESGHLPDRPILIEAGQSRVIDWALKNGYQFMTEAEAELYEQIQSDQSEHILDTIYLARNPDPYLVRYDADVWQSGEQAEAAILALRPRRYRTIELAGVTPLRFGLTKSL